MNRVIILESLLTLAAVLVLGPGSSALVEQAARQAGVGQNSPPPRAAVGRQTIQHRPSLRCNQHCGRAGPVPQSARHRRWSDACKA